MLNEIFKGPSTENRFYACPSTIVAGDAVLIGGVLPAIAVDNYSSVSGGTLFRLAGTFELTVIGATTVSPLSGSAVKPGEVIYGGGTTDATTGMIHTLTLSKQTDSTVAFGTYDGEGIDSGETDTAARVKLLGAPK